MKNVRYSTTFIEQFNLLLAQGEPKFGALVVDQKRDRVYDVIDSFLARHPDAKQPHSRLKLCVYPITKTPFVVLYDFDDAELRAHFIFHNHADLRTLDPTAAKW